MKSFETITNCLLCEGKIKFLFSLGSTPLANEFVKEPINQEVYPLNLIQCQECGHVQLDTIVKKEKIFKKYFYVSGTSSTNIQHFKEYAEKIINTYLPNYPSNYFVVDVGGNDGTFAKNFVDKKIKCISIDPAENLAKTAKEKNNVDTIVDFFGTECAKKIIKQCGKANIIAMNNIFAHNKDLKDILLGAKILLSDNGILVFENSYLLDMCDKTLPDLVYSEHIHHHSLSALTKFFDRNEMKIFDVERIPNHGGSIRVYACHKSDKRRKKQSVIKLLKLEENLNEKLQNFEKNILQLKKDLTKILTDIKKENKKICIYGFPAKATTLLEVLKIDPKIIEFVVEDAILKQGTYTPGTHIKIYHPKELYKHNIDYVLILGWNFADTIIENNKEFKGKWIIPIPEIQIV